MKAIVQYSGKPTQNDVLSWQDLLKKGREESDEALEDRLKQVAINQCCHLVYTSGTTGNPKAAMLSNDNLTFTARVAVLVCEFKDKGQESLVSYLPLSHIAAYMLDLFVLMACQGTVYFADKNALKVCTTY